MKTIDMAKILLKNPTYKAEYRHKTEHYLSVDHIFMAYINKYGELCIDYDNNLIHLQLEDNRVWKIIKPKD